MLKSIAVGGGSYVLSIVLVLATDPLLSRLFPGDFIRGRAPPTLYSSRARRSLLSSRSFVPGSAPALLRAARHVLSFFIVGEAMGIAASIPNWKTGWPHWYWLSWLLTWPLSCWIGLMISGRRADLAAA